MNYCSDKEHYILWVKSTCPWCEKATELLSENSLSHTVFNLEEQPEVLVEAKNNLNWQTVPIVFKATSSGFFELVGGYTDLEKLIGGENDTL